MCQIGYFSGYTTAKKFCQLDGEALELFNKEYAEQQDLIKTRREIRAAIGFGSVTDPKAKQDLLDWEERLTAEIKALN